MLAVANCFKYRYKIGLDVAIEALRECSRERRCTMDDLWHFADVCRVRNVMRPYMLNQPEYFTGRRRKRSNARRSRGNIS